MKLELKHLAPYLPYKLGVASGDEYDSILSNIGIMGTHYDVYAPNNYTIYQLCKCEDGVFKYMGVRPIQVKPILRPLSSMTKDEATEIFKIVFKDDYLDEDFPVELRVWGDSSISIKSGSFNRCRRIEIYVQDEVLSIEIKYNLGGYIAGGAVSYNINEWLFSHHFDVFNLIENDLAIDKTKL